MPATPATASACSAAAPLPFRRIAVFCGSSAGTSPLYRQAAVELGAEMARRGIGLVYGGGIKSGERRRIGRLKEREALVSFSIQLSLVPQP